MNRHWSTDRNVHGSPDPTLDVDDAVLHDVPPRPVIGDGVQLTGLRIALGVGGVAPGQSALEVRWPDGLQFVRQLVRSGTCLDDGKGLSGMGDDIGVGREVHPIHHRSGMRFLTQGRRHVGRTDPPVPIPAGSAVFDPDPVDHPVPGEPVVGGRIRWCDRIGAVAQIAAVQRGRKRSGDREIGHRLFAGDWGVVAQQIRVGQGHRNLLRLVRPVLPDSRRPRLGRGVGPTEAGGPASTRSTRRPVRHVPRASRCGWSPERSGCPPSRPAGSSRRWWSP